MPTEFQTKQSRLHAFLDRHALDGVFLWNRNNFAWITAGGDNHIASFLPFGVAGILATRDGKRVCLTNAIEAPRFRDEELAGMGIDVIEYPWHDLPAGQKVVREVFAGRRIAADHDELGLGLGPLPGDFAELRWSLLPEEIERYRDGGRRTAIGMEQACRAIKPAMSEHEIAGLLDQSIRSQSLNPVVTLVAVDERIERFRHPIPTRTRLRRYAMLVVCAESAGLISNVTRFVHFGPMPAELRRKHQAVANVDASVNLATRPGRTLGAIFADLQAAYAREGFADQWKLHHQGGSTGYNGREVFANPTSEVRVLENQAFAWNPSITGTKSEDTVLVTASGVEILTPTTRDWPTLEGHAPQGTLRRADMLVV
jgi:Xaa-Pro aminopeptidase